MKYLEQMFATYVYSHCNICNIQIYFCNIHMKHLQHTSETLKNIRSKHALSANPGRRVGGRSTAQQNPTLGRGGEGGWSRDTAKEVGPETEMATESARGPPHGLKAQVWFW
jgi:hypothetical protein